MPANPTAAASLASAASMVLLFEALPDALARRKVLDQLERAHAKLLARESGPELDDEQQTAAQVASLASQAHPESALPSLTPDGHAARLATVPDLSAAYDGFRVFLPGATSAPSVCWAGRDGECTHAGCPQLRDNEPAASGRHCPLDDAHEARA